MSTTVHALSVDQVNDLKASAQNFGFDGGVVADVLEKFGPEVLALVVEAARSGFSVQWIMDTLYKFGPAVLQFFRDMWNSNAMAAAAQGEGVVLTGELVEGFDANFLQVLLEKFLPVLLDKFGPKIIEAILKSLVKSPQFAAGGELWTTILNAVIQAVTSNPQLLQQIIAAILDALKPKSPVFGEEAAH